MSPRDPFGIDPDDLDVRARRGLLSRAEQRELERALEANPALRIAYEIGRDMDAATAVRGGDDALIARAASAAQARATGEPAVAPPVAAPQRGPRRVAAAAIALGVLSASGMAAALWTGMMAWPFGSALRDGAVARPQPQPRVELRRAAPASAAPTPAPTATSTVESVASLPARSAQRGGAAELFRAANAARRGGDFARAARLYAELRSRHPGSDEAGLARVSLGQLLLARGDAAGAATEFRRYLARGRGPLSEEALVGQAQSLQALGRARAERVTLQRLLADFPGTVYAAQARARLAAIDAGTVDSVR